VLQAPRRAGLLIALHAGAEAGQPRPRASKPASIWQPHVRIGGKHSDGERCRQEEKKKGPPVGVLRSAAHRRAESRFWGVFVIAVHRAFVLGLGARHRGIVELSEGG